MTDSFRQAYKEEARELLADLEESLLELEEDPKDMELISRVFRALHTIKGSGAMFGFDNIASFTHAIESVYDQVRDGKLLVSKELINVTLKAKDQIKYMIDDEDNENTLTDGKENNFDAVQKEIMSLVDLYGREEGGFPQPATELALSVDNDSVSIRKSISKDTTYRICFAPENNIFLAGSNPLLLFNELNNLGECKVIAQLDKIPLLDEINPEYCYTYWDVVITTDKDLDEIRDVFIFVEDSCELSISVISADKQGEGHEEQKKIGEILIERGNIAEKDLICALAEQKKIGEILIEKGFVQANIVESALAEQERVKKIVEKGHIKEEESSIRVARIKVEFGVNLVGELVTAQARLTRSVAEIRSVELSSIAEEVERLTAELRDSALSMRMVAIGNTFGRFRRLVRDLSLELHKEIELITDGAETELDKTVIEKMNDPLVHLIRNCIDHGIEMPDLRESLGKPRVGTIRLSASHVGGQFVLRIEDDGRGLSKDSIYVKALEKGLILHNTELSDKEVCNLIFYPGFSTAEKITNISGRGVGMDVVKKAIDRVRGSIDIESESGHGTTVTIKLPLTLVMVDGLLVNIGVNSFVIPLAVIEECVELKYEDCSETYGRNLLDIRGKLVPLIRLRKVFNISGDPPAIEQIIVIGANGDRVGFVVDQVIGSHQTVIKNLGNVYKNVDGISGATVLGNGNVALIIDVEKLKKEAECVS